MESKNTLECYICFDVPNKPVTTTCGHIFCWKCIQAWISSKDKLECPVCKNGFTKEGIIPLYTGKNDTTEVDDRPKIKRTAPGVNNSNTFFGNILRGVGYYGSESQQGDVPLPSSDEVKVNQMATIVCIVAFILIFSIFYLD